MNLNVSQIQIYDLAFRFEERTSSLCVITGGEQDSIAGHQSIGEVTKEDCKSKCEKYEWCRGVRVTHSDKKECRLLTNNSIPIDGYNYMNSGRWAEPKAWKEKILDSSINPTYRCLEKIEIRKLEIV